MKLIHIIFLNACLQILTDFRENNTRNLGGDLQSHCPDFLNRVTKLWLSEWVSEPSEVLLLLEQRAKLGASQGKRIRGSAHEDHTEMYNLNRCPRVLTPAPPACAR